MDKHNPAVVAEMRDQWYKLCAMVMFKTGTKQITLTADDVQRFTQSSRKHIMVRAGDRITLSLIDDAQAEQLRKNGAIEINYD